MKALTETVISLFDLLEAESRLLQRRAVQTCAVALLMLLAAALTAGAFTLLLLALYQFLITYWPPTLAYLAMGLVCLLLAGGVLWIAMQTQRQA